MLMSLPIDSIRSREDAEHASMCDVQRPLDGVQRSPSTDARPLVRRSPYPADRRPNARTPSMWTAARRPSRA